MSAPVETSKPATGVRSRPRASRVVACVAVAAALAVIWSVLHRDLAREPSYQGRRLRAWMRGHPRDYVPAVQAMGTNAIPFLLSELTVQDSGLKQSLEEVFRRAIDSPPPWETARMRQYHAFLALQALGSNALPAMLEAVLRPPVRAGDVEFSAGVASALAMMGFQSEIQPVLSAALLSDQPALRLSAFRAFGAGVRGDLEAARQLVAFTRSTNVDERWGATRALVFWQTNEVDVISALVERLEDPDPAIRRRAVDALGGRQTNALAALPALLRAYTNEVGKPHPADTADPIYRGHAVSVNEVRWAIRWAIGQVDPKAQPPWTSR